MRYILLTIALFIMTGCQTMTPAEKLEGDVYFKYMNTNANCQDRSIALSRQLTKAGIDHVAVVGDLDGSKHMWIESEGKIYDPSWSNVDPSRYTKEKELK